jgi:hypothetical protein
VQAWRHARCPCCRSGEIVVRRRIDKIDRRRSNAFNLLHKVMGGRLYYCWVCRFQFHDLRKRKQSVLQR